MTIIMKTDFLESPPLEQEGLGPGTEYSEEGAMRTGSELLRASLYYGKENLQKLLFTFKGQCQAEGSQAHFEQILNFSELQPTHP